MCLTRSVPGWINTILDSVNQAMSQRNGGIQSGPVLRSNAYGFVDNT